MFLALSLCGGLLLAGLALPALAVTAGGINLTVSSMNDLPQELMRPPQPEASTVYLADGSVLATFYDQNRTYVGLDQIAPVMAQAQVAIEDKRFYDHSAVDVQGLLRALALKFLGGQQQGASTLTQQYVKQVRIQLAQDANDKVALNAATENTYARKIVEMRYAMALEKELTKDQILENYLNIVYYGQGAYGVEAAAQRYFGVEASQLSLAQAALLAGLTQNPSTSDPITNPNAAIARRNVVLDTMAADDVGYITQAQADLAKQEPLDTSHGKVSYTGCGNARANYEFLCDYVQRVLVSDQMPGLGGNPTERADTLKRGGLQIHTLIDPAIQDQAVASLQAQVGATDPAIGAAVSIQPSTGLILAMAQSRPFGPDKAAGQTTYNYAVDFNMGGAEGFRAGSTFKAFTLAAALSQGALYSTVYPGTSPMSFDNTVYQTCSGNWTYKHDNPLWRPKNVDKSYGEIDLTKALVNSVNTYFLQLERDVGLCNVVKMAQNLGVVAARPGAPNGQGQYVVDLKNGSTDLVTGWGMDYVPSFTLGVIEVSPLTMAQAYGTFANNGVHCDPIVLQSVQMKDGTDVPVPSANCKQVIDQNLAAGVSQGLQQVLKNGTASTYGVVKNGYPQAGKTGTTDDQDTEWLVGYTPEVATAAVVSCDKLHAYWTNRKITLNGLRLSTGVALTGSSGHDAGILWRPVMTTALEGKPATPFPTYIPIKGNFKSKYTPKPSAAPTPSATAPAATATAGGGHAAPPAQPDQPPAPTHPVLPTGRHS